MPRPTTSVYHSEDSRTKNELCRVYNVLGLGGGNNASLIAGDKQDVKRIARENNIQVQEFSGSGALKLTIGS